MFQGKIQRALKGVKGEGDAIRHELISAAVWDDLFGTHPDEAIGEALIGLTPEMIDASCVNAAGRLIRLHSDPERELGFGFLKEPGVLPM